MTHAAMRCRAREGVDRMEMFLFGPSRAIASWVSRGGARYARRDACDFARSAGRRSFWGFLAFAKSRVDVLRWDARRAER